MSLTSGAAAVISPASALMSLRASSRSICGSGSSARPHLTAAALSRCTAAVLMTSTAGTSAMSRVRMPRPARALPLGVAGVIPVRVAVGGAGDWNRAHALLSARLRRAPERLLRLESGFTSHPRLTASRLPGHSTPPSRRRRRGSQGAGAARAGWTVNRFRPRHESSRRGGRIRIKRRSASAIPAPMTASACRRSDSSARQASRSASSASRSPFVLRRKPISTSSRSLPTRSRPSSRSWTTASSSTRQRRRRRRPDATRRTRSSRRSGSV